MTNGKSRTTDPWRGVRVGDRFYLCGWNAQMGDQIWQEVGVLYFDPVKGQSNPKRGYMAGVRLMGSGDMRAITIGTLAGKSYRRVEVALSNAMEDMEWFVNGR